MQIGITGSSGFLGTSLARYLTSQGHRVVRFVRRPVTAEDERTWSGTTLEPDALADLDGHVHLSGAGVGDRRWTPSYRETIRRSRVDTTSAVAHAIRRAGTPVLLAQNAIGYYGDRGDEILDEGAPPGDGFLAGVGVEWEAAAAPAAASSRLVVLRTGVVLGSLDGKPDPLLRRLKPLVKGFLGAPVGRGGQYVSWIALADWLAAVHHLLESSVAGPVNAVSPNPVTNADLTKALGSVLHRPTWPIGVPGPVVRLVAGGLADEALGSARVVPAVLQRDGFTWTHPHLVSALRAAVAPT